MTRHATLILRSARQGASRRTRRLALLSSALCLLAAACGSGWTGRDLKTTAVHVALFEELRAGAMGDQLDPDCVLPRVRYAPAVRAPGGKWLVRASYNPVNHAITVTDPEACAAGTMGIFDCGAEVERALLHELFHACVAPGRYPVADPSAEEYDAGRADGRPRRTTPKNVLPAGWQP